MYHRERTQLSQVSPIVGLPGEGSDEGVLRSPQESMQFIPFGFHGFDAGLGGFGSGHEVSLSDCPEVTAHGIAARCRVTSHRRPPR